VRLFGSPYAAGRVFVVRALRSPRAQLTPQQKVFLSTHAFLNNSYAQAAAVNTPIFPGRRLYLLRRNERSFALLFVEHTFRVGELEEGLF
jgi:hypothetical protein